MSTPQNKYPLYHNTAKSLGYENIRPFPPLAGRGRLPLDLYQLIESTIAMGLTYPKPLTPDSPFLGQTHPDYAQNRLHAVDLTPDGNVLWLPRTDFIRYLKRVQTRFKQAPKIAARNQTLAARRARKPLREQRKQVRLLKQAAVALRMEALRNRRVAELETLRIRLRNLEQFPPTTGTQLELIHKARVERLKIRIQAQEDLLTRKRKLRAQKKTAL
jgi:hypothetical protein